MEYLSDEEISGSACAIAVVLPGQLFAASLEERLEAVESRQAELYKSLEERREAPLGVLIGDRLTLSALLEVQGLYASQKPAKGKAESESDLFLKTVQLALNAKLNDATTTNLSLLDDSEEGFEVDTATLDFEQAGKLARVGRQYLPFGEYPTNFIEDPLTLTLGSTRETALLAGYGDGRFNFSTFLFRGDRNGDQISDWGAAARFSPAEGVEFGASFLSDLTESDDGLPTLAVRKERVGGLSGFARFGTGQVEASLEILGAVKAFADSDLDADGDGNGDRPLAWNAEIACLSLTSHLFALRLGGSSEWEDHPALQYGVNATYSVAKGMHLSAEYLHEDYERDFSALKRRDLINTMLTVEF